MFIFTYVRFLFLYSKITYVCLKFMFAIQNGLMLFIFAIQGGRMLFMFAIQDCQFANKDWRR